MSNIHNNKELDFDTDLEDIDFDEIEFEEEETTDEDESLNDETIEDDYNFDENTEEDDYNFDEEDTLEDNTNDYSEDDTISKDADFISETGEIVVMNTNDNGENFELIYVDIENIAIVHRIRKGTNVESLVKSIKSTGLLNPIVVAPTATDGLYVLLEGYRRVLACARAGKRRIPCILNKKVSTPEIPVLEALYNHNKAYTVKEMVDYIDYLEKEKGIMSASMIEYLLQMNNGDYTKLKDILNDNDEDIVDKLFTGIFTIEQAFKKLEQRRKKETAEAKEIQKAERVYGNEEESGADAIQGSGEEADEDIALTEEEIKSLAINPESLDEDLDGASLSELVKEGENIEGFEAHKQDSNNRERLDPALRKSVLARDKNTCQICKEISGQEYTEVLDVHHINEVYLGGDDSIDNLITACVVCHKLVHLYGRGELYIRPLEELSNSEQEKFKRIVKLGTVIRKGMAMKGIKKDQLKKLDKAETIGRRLKGSSDQVAG